MKKIILFLLFTFMFTNLSAENPHFIDFGKVLNESVAGKKAQDSLKKNLSLRVVNLKKSRKI